TQHNGSVVIDPGPPAGPPALGDLDVHLFHEGRHERLWTVLGALPNGDGVTFRVWAPHAREVRVIGDAPGWGAYEGARMRPGPSGIWEVTLTGAAPGQRYKYRVHGHD